VQPQDRQVHQSVKKMTAMYMAGGIFPSKPFEWNVKCVVFSAILAGGYWFAPRKNVWVLLFLLWAPYIAMAWYDYAYDCQSKLQPTAVPYGRYIWLPFKPPGYKKNFDDLSSDKIAIMDRVDHVTTWTILVAAIAVAAWKFS
jgi:hypothetical protein